jgi:hypothetical protein
VIPRKIDPARGWLFVAKLLASEEIDEVDRLDDEGVAAALRARGRDPDKLTGVDALKARAAAIAEREAATPPATAAGLTRPARWRARHAWLAAGSLGLLAAAVVPVNRDPDRVGAAPDPVMVRAAGFGACHRHEWDACERELDAARALDPDGEAVPAVKEARSRIEAARKAQEPEREPERKQEAP